MRITRQAWLIWLLAILLPTAIFAASSQQDKAKQLIEKVTKGRFVIEKSFKSVGNLQGFVIKPKAEGVQSTIAYADKDGRYMVVGAVINAKGENLTQDDFVKYVQSKIAAEAFKAAATTAWFQDGKKNAKHQLYILGEPNCSMCHRLYQELKPYVASGEVSSRWIMVHFLKPSSQGKAAAILQAKDPAKAMALDEAKFKMATETGGITPAKTIASATEQKLKKNMTFMKKFGFRGTPVLIYQDKNGKAHLIQGLISGTDLKKVIQTMGTF